jgi:hypothetical protein
MGREGLEHPANSSGNSAESKQCGAKNGALDPELARLITVWPGLSTAITRAIMALISI